MCSDIPPLHTSDCSSFSFETETVEQQLVGNLICLGMIVFDVGANVGDYSILFSKLVGESGQVYAFEPASSTVSILQQRLDKFDCRNVVAIRKAVFSEDGIVTLNEFPDDYSAWNSLGIPKMHNPADPSVLVPIVKTEAIDAIRLDTFCSEVGIEKIDYLKVDVEGAERDVLEGAGRLLGKQAISFIQFEVSQNMLDGLNRTAKDVFETLIRFGYECHRILDDGEIGETVVDSDAFYENYIAFPRLTSNLQTLFGRVPDKLSQARAELKKTQTELQQTQAELQQTQTELQQTQNQRDSVQNQLYQTQIQLAETQAQLSKSQHLLFTTQAHLQQVEVKLQNTESALERSHDRAQRLEGSLENAKGRLDRARDTINMLRNRIEAMETSKFWKLRTGWFMLKRKLGVKTDD